MCLFRKCNETVIETKEYPSVIERLKSLAAERFTVNNPSASLVRRKLVTTIKCSACGRIRIDERSV